MAWLSDTKHTHPQSARWPPAALQPRAAHGGDATARREWLSQPRQALRVGEPLAVLCVHVGLRHSAVSSPWASESGPRLNALAGPRAHPTADSGTAESPGSKRVPRQSPATVAPHRSISRMAAGSRDLQARNHTCPGRPGHARQVTVHAGICSAYTQMGAVGSAAAGATWPVTSAGRAPVLPPTCLSTDQ